MRPAALAIAALGLLAAGCRRDEPQEDRALRLLKAEADREAAGAQVQRSPHEPQDPNARLAGLAAGAEDRRAFEGTIPLAREGGSAVVNGVLARVLGATASHRVAGNKLSLTTEDLFVTVELALQNTTQRANGFDVPNAALLGGEGRWTVARDAQALAGSRNLPVELAAGQTQTVTLVFEVPPSAVAPEAPLELHLPAPLGGNGDARLRLK